MKRKIIFLFVFSLSISFLFAKTDVKTAFETYTDETVNMPSLDKNTSLLNIPLSAGIPEFAQVLDNVTIIVSRLVILFAFLMIIFNSFKLWAGTLEIKKAFVDMIYKCVMCMLIIIIYRPATNTIIKMATEFGTTLSGGYKKIDTVYVDAYNVLTKNIEKGLPAVKEGILKNSFTVTTEEGYKHKYISSEAVDTMRTYGMNESQIKDFCNQNGLLIASYYEVKTDRNNYLGTDLDNATYEMWAKQEENNGWYDAQGNKIKGTFAYTTSSWFSGVQTNGKNVKKLLNDAEGTSDKEQRLWATKINALTEVLTEESIKVEKKDANGNTARDSQGHIAYETIKNVFFSPWLRDKNGAVTMFIAPSSMIKVISVLQDAVYYAYNEEIDGVTGEITDIDKELDSSKHFGLRKLVNWICALLYKFVMWICVLIIMAEYTITILEFYLIRGIATLLIPLMFIDATKSYAQNLLKLALSYFMKILVIVLICYWSIGLFMDISISIMQNFDYKATETLGIYLFACITGLMLSLKAPRLADVVMHGQPALGVGDVLQTARSALYTANHASHAMKGAMHQFGGKMMKAAHVGATFGVANSAARANASNVENATKAELKNRQGNVQALQSRFENGEQLSSEEMQELQAGQGLLNMSKDDIDTAARNAGKNAKRNQMFRMVKDWGYSKLAGFDNNVENYGALRVGQQFFDGNQVRQATARDVRNSEFQEKNNQQYVDNALEKASKKHGKNQDADFDQKELDAKFKQNWPIQGL